MASTSPSSIEEASPSQQQYKGKAGSLLAPSKRLEIIGLLRRMHFRDTLNSISPIIQPTASSWKI